MKTTTNLILCPVDTLKLYPNNARQHSELQIEKLRESMRIFGFVAPILIDATGSVLAGEARLVAAKAEGFVEVPCILVEHLTEEQGRAYRLTDNRLAELSEWDESLVVQELAALQAVGFDICLTGFDEALLLPEAEDIVQDEEIPSPVEAVTACEGDLYSLGRHRLLCGDATKMEDVARLMAGAQADLLLTDPPYNVDVTGGTKDHLKILCDAMDDVGFTDFLEKAFRTAYTVLAPGGAFYIWHADGASGLSFRLACDRAGFPVRQCLIWVKQSATLGRQDYQWQHEPCLHGERELDLPSIWDEHEACLYGWKAGQSHLWCSDRKQTTVIECERPSRSEEHPTMKPVRLFAYCIQNSTLPGALVADFFAGSGTTLIACEQLSRCAYLMEKDPRFVDVILKRWARFGRGEAVKLESQEATCGDAQSK